MKLSLSDQPWMKSVSTELELALALSNEITMFDSSLLDTESEDT